MNPAFTFALGGIALAISYVKTKIKPNPSKDPDIAKKNKKAETLVQALKAASAAITAYVSPDIEE